MISIEQKAISSISEEDLKKALFEIQKRIREMEINGECSKNNDRCTEYAYLMRLERVASNRLKKSLKPRF